MVSVHNVNLANSPAISKPQGWIVILIGNSPVIYMVSKGYLDTCQGISLVAHYSQRGNIIWFIKKNKINVTKIRFYLLRLSTSLLNLTCLDTIIVLI